MKELLSIIIFLTIALLSEAATLTGRVSDAVGGEPLEFASVSIDNGAYFCQTSVDGRFALNITDGQHRLRVSYVGYITAYVDIAAGSGSSVDIALTPAATSLKEVVITAREGEGLTSTSRIDREAMQHLQPTSFTDLLELLPGNISRDPDTGSANTITLRETGNLSATGVRSSNDDYAITSLGTQFVVDGAPMNTDADMQSIPNTDSSDPSSRRSVTNKGIDMRTISTDNIESVEIVRGIPSAEFGNLTSGVVNIKRIRRSTPFTFRFKADEYSKLFSASKGISLGATNHLLNLDAGYLDSKTDPRNALENYKRLTAGVRPTLRFPSASTEIIWNCGIDYTGSFDNAKTDPDLNYNKIDEYRSSYNKISFISDLNIGFRRTALIENIVLNVSASYQHDEIKRRKQVAPQRASVAPTSMDEGVHDGHYLLGEYIADYRVDGQPLALNLRLKASGKAGENILLCQYKAGIEWSFSKNYGAGQVYDLERPLSAAWTTRPRRFSDIPGLTVASAFAEADLALNVGGGSKAELRAGVRVVTLPLLDRSYWLSGHVYADPRINAAWHFPTIDAGRELRFMIACGWGMTTKMPTIDYLFPQTHYNDLIQLNYYDTTHPDLWSRVSLRTYRVDASNRNLRAARNSKRELRFGVSWGNNRLSVTYFDERLRSGFRYTPVYDRYSYRVYDATAIDPSGLSAPPMLDNLPYADAAVLDGFRRPSNGTRIDKQGVEYQISTERWMPLRTSLIINGAWFRSTYSNSQMLYSTVSDVVGNQAVSDRFVGIYDTTDGRVNEQFNTNFMFDTQIPRWGLLFSTTLQCMWYVKTTRLRDNPVPTSYLSADDGEIHPFTAESAADPVLRYLIKSYNDDAYRTQRIPTALYLNLKATKRIGRRLNLSAFVNRILDYLPDYKSNGLTVRRNSDAYFGMEAVLTL